MSVSGTFQLKSGDRVGFFEIGNPKGVPCFFFHGYPGSSRQVTVVQDPEVFHHVRLIGVDRPGFGDSTLPKKRTMQDFAQNIEELANHFGFEKFHLIAVSGGNPYAFIVGDQLRDRVLSLTSVCGLGPLFEKEIFASMDPRVQWILRLGRTSPALMGPMMAKVIEIIQKQEKPDASKLAKILSSEDVILATDAKVLSVIRGSMKHAFKQGGKGPALEMKMIQQDWKIQDWNLPFPVSFWHGMNDKIVPPLHSQVLSSRVPGSQLNLIPNEGHYSLPILRMRKILEASPLMKSV